MSKENIRKDKSRRKFEYLYVLSSWGSKFAAQYQCSGVVIAAWI